MATNSTQKLNVEIVSETEELCLGSGLLCTGQDDSGQAIWSFSVFFPHLKNEDSNTFTTYFPHHLGESALLELKHECGLLLF